MKLDEIETPNHIKERSFGNIDRFLKSKALGQGRTSKNLL